MGGGYSSLWWEARGMAKEPTNPGSQISKSPYLSKFSQLLTDFLIYVMVLWTKFG